MAVSGINGKNRECMLMQNEIMELAQKLFCDVNPIPVKEAMHQLKMCSNVLRLPLDKTSDKNKLLIADVLNKYNYLLSLENSAE